MCTSNSNSYARAGDDGALSAQQQRLGRDGEPSPPHHHTAGTQRKALKRRGLSKFYAFKSQSFSALELALSTQFGDAAMGLAKRPSSHDLRRCLTASCTGLPTQGEAATAPPRRRQLPKLKLQHQQECSSRNSGAVTSWGGQGEHDSVLLEAECEGDDDTSSTMEPPVIEHSLTTASSGSCSQPAQAAPPSPPWHRPYSSRSLAAHITAHSMLGVAQQPHAGPASGVSCHSQMALQQRQTVLGAGGLTSTAAATTSPAMQCQQQLAESAADVHAFGQLASSWLLCSTDELCVALHRATLAAWPR